MAKITAIGIAVAICIGLVGYALYWDTTEVPKLKAQAENHIALQENILVSKMSRCLLYTSPSPRDRTRSRMPSSA